MVETFTWACTISTVALIYGSVASKTLVFALELAEGEGGQCPLLDPLALFVLHFFRLRKLFTPGQRGVQRAPARIGYVQPTR